MIDQEPPRIEFPCANYPIKVMGVTSEEFRAYVTEVMLRHVIDFDLKNIQIKPSKNGRFESITVHIRATGKDQLSTIFEDLKKHPLLRMVL